MQPRTKRQKQVLDYIKNYIEKHGYEPSYQQIAIHLGVSSKAGIAKHIEALEQLGLISRIRENGSFRLEINPTQSISELISEISWLELPLDETPDAEIEPLFVPKIMIGDHLPETISAIRAVDDSMIEEHICEGDIVLVENRSYARDGDTVVALLTEKQRTVILKFFRAGANIELRPANPAFKSISVRADKIEIKGVLCSVLRPPV